jgi:hypothetical protein
MKMPGFAAEAAFGRTSNSYITHSTMTNSITDAVLPQISWDRCISLWRRKYIGCRLDGGQIDLCSEIADVYWGDAGCPD